MWSIPPPPWMMWLWLDVKCGGYYPLPPQMKCLSLDVKCGRYPTPHPIGSWELKWHVWCGDVEEDLSPIGHQQLRGEVTCNVEEDPVGHQELRVEVTCPTWWCIREPTPHWPSAVESWSDMCCVEDVPPTPIGHQQLRVEVTCVMWRIPHWPSTVKSWSDMCSVEDVPPIPIGHQQLRVEVICVMWRRIHPHWPSAVESWSDVWCGGPPLAIGS